MGAETLKAQESPAPIGPARTLYAGNVSGNGDEEDQPARSPAYAGTHGNLIALINKK